MSDEPIFTPNREQRRRVACLMCCMCQEQMRSADILGVRTDDAVLWMHGRCIKSLLENAETEES